MSSFDGPPRDAAGQAVDGSSGSAQPTSPAASSPKSPKAKTKPLLTRAARKVYKTITAPTKDADGVRVPISRTFSARLQRGSPRSPTPASPVSTTQSAMLPATASGASPRELLTGSQSAVLPASSPRSPLAQRAPLASVPSPPPAAASTEQIAQPTAPVDAEAAADDAKDILTVEDAPPDTDRQRHRFVGPTEASREALPTVEGQDSTREAGERIGDAVPAAADQANGRASSEAASAVFKRPASEIEPLEAGKSFKRVSAVGQSEITAEARVLDQASAGDFQARVEAGQYNEDFRFQAEVQGGGETDSKTIGDYAVHGAAQSEQKAQNAPSAYVVDSSSVPAEAALVHMDPTRAVVAAAASEPMPLPMPRPKQAVAAADDAASEAGSHSAVRPGLGQAVAGSDVGFAFETGVVEAGLSVTASDDVDDLAASDRARVFAGPADSAQGKLADDPAAGGVFHGVLPAKTSAPGAGSVSDSTLTSGGPAAAAANEAVFVTDFTAPGSSDSFSGLGSPDDDKHSSAASGGGGGGERSSQVADDDYVAVAGMEALCVPSAESAAAPAASQAETGAPQAAGAGEGISQEGASSPPDPLAEPSYAQAEWLTEDGKPDGPGGAVGVEADAAVVTEAASYVHAMVPSQRAPHDPLAQPEVPADQMRTLAPGAITIMGKTDAADADERTGKFARPPPEPPLQKSGVDALESDVAELAASITAGVQRHGSILSALAAQRTGSAAQPPVHAAAGPEQLAAAKALGHGAASAGQQEDGGGSAGTPEIRAPPPLDDAEDKSGGAAQEILPDPGSAAEIAPSRDQARDADPTLNAVKDLDDSGKRKVPGGRRLRRVLVSGLAILVAGAAAAIYKKRQL